MLQETMLVRHIIGLLTYKTCAHFSDQKQKQMEKICCVVWEKRWLYPPCHSHKETSQMQVVYKIIYVQGCQIVLSFECVQLSRDAVGFYKSCRKHSLPLTLLSWQCSYSRELASQVKKVLKKRRNKIQDIRKKTNLQ